MKKTFILLLVLMVLVAACSTVLVVTGHEALVRDAFREVALNIKDVLIGAAIVVVFIVMVCAL